MIASPHAALGIGACIIGLAVVGAMSSRTVHIARKLRTGEVRTRTGSLLIRERPAAALGYLLVETIVIAVCGLIGMQALLWGSWLILTPSPR